MRNLAALLVLAMTAAAGDVGGPLYPSPDQFFHPTDTEGALYGGAFAGVGDLNGDSYDDVVIGAPGQDRVYVHYGCAGGLSESPETVLQDPLGEGSFGSCVAAAGDVNGDGYPDVLVGAPLRSTSMIQEGRAYLYYGGPDGLWTSPVWTADGEQTWASYGLVAAAGDVNRDGYADVLVGSPTYHLSDMSAEGRLYLYLGGPEGLRAGPDWTLTGAQPFDSVGMCQGGGDFNGDGYGDVAVGLLYHTDRAEFEGLVAAFHGGPGGLSGEVDWSAPGKDAYLYLGSGIASADVNGDGCSDLLVGALGYRDEDGGRVGGMYVWHGSPAGLEDAPAIVIGGEQVNGGFGCGMASAGDVDLDGCDDVVIAASGDAGRTYLYMGGAGGLADRPAWQTWGSQPGGSYGAPIAGVGDVNDDGIPDVLVGDCGADRDKEDEGAVHLFLGRTMPGADATPPVAGIVSDGPEQDLETQESTTRIDATWTGFADGESGVAGYEWAIGTLPGATDVQRFKNVGTARSASNASLELSIGTTYYVTVRAVNGAGAAVRSSSDGVKVVRAEMKPEGRGEGGGGGGRCGAGGLAGGMLWGLLAVGVAWGASLRRS